MKKLRILFSCSISLAGAKAYSLPFAQGRTGAGYAFLPGTEGGKAVHTAIVSGVGRFGYKFVDSNYFMALDVTAYRVFKSGTLGSKNDGNSLLFVYGHDWPAFNLWLAGGAGELRSFDRETEETRPYRYYATDMQLGMNFDLYRSEEARVQLGIAMGRLTPDPEWRERYGVSSINSLQFDIGFKLLNW